MKHHGLTVGSIMSINVLTFGPPLELDNDMVWKNGYIIVGTSFVFVRAHSDQIYFWLWCQSDPEWPPQDSNLGSNALTPVRCPPGIIWASSLVATMSSNPEEAILILTHFGPIPMVRLARAKNTPVQSRIKQMTSQQLLHPSLNAQREKTSLNRRKQKSMSIHMKHHGLMVGSILSVNVLTFKHGTSIVLFTFAAWAWKKSEYDSKWRQVGSFLNPTF